MSNLTAKDLIEFYDTSRHGDLTENIRNERLFQTSVEIVEYLNESAGLAQKVVLERMTEQDVAKIRNLIAFTLQATLLSEGKSPPCFGMSDDDLEFIDSMIFSVVGILIKEEVL